MNKKGVTLVEIIVSISLIVVVLIFMFKLLVNIRYEQSYSSYDQANSVNRTEIIRNIQNDFLNLNIVGVYDDSINSDTLKLRFVFGNDTEKTLTVTEQNVYYDDTKWSLKANNTVTKLITSCASYSYNFDAKYDYFMFKILIKVDNGSDEDSILDDIELFYLGKKTEDITIPLDQTYLGYGAKTNACGDGV